MNLQNNIEVVDVSGVKTIDEINQQFKGSFSDITQQVVAQAQQQNAIFIGGLNGTNN